MKPEVVKEMKKPLKYHEKWTEEEHEALIRVLKKSGKDYEQML